jgi:2-polyprenyl-6-methoxyphenol hydroxylase-like FAD-dependent oxidoreductase
MPDRPTDSDADVLIVGAGPTGLVLALWLAKAGVRVRVVDKAEEPGTTSRALVVHARTLELYRQLGIADAIVAAGIEFAAVNLWIRGRHAARAQLGEVGKGISPFPYMLILPQDVHERLLIKELERNGVRIARGREVIALRQTEAGVEVDVQGSDGTATMSAAYLAGCDGAHSMARRALGVEFGGGTYDRMFYVADVEAGTLMDKELHVALDEADFVAVFPLAGEHRGRLIGVIDEAAIKPGHTLTWDDVSTSALERLAMRVDRVNWFSSYHVHHRVATHFRVGRCFLLGDAAHIHSPVGGQGMNTGIGDAVNLAWKLADVVQGRASERILDTYEPERIAFARRLVETTDRAFVITTKNGPLARFVRLTVLPLLLPPLLRRRSLRRMMFRILSQTRIAYHKSALSRGAAGRVRGGARLPWVEHATPDGGDNYTPLERRNWQIQVYGDAAEAVVTVAAEHHIELVRFPWTPDASKAGFARGAAYLVRPDGYVAAAARAGEVSALVTLCSLLRSG